MSTAAHQTPPRARWMRPVLLGESVLVLALFVFSLACRTWDPLATSITYDEQAAKDSGPWWPLLKAGDFSSEGWGYGKPTVAIPRWLYGVVPQSLSGEDPGNPRDLVGARRVAAVLGAVQVVVVYGVGRLFGGTTVGLLAALAFSLFPGVLGHDRLASHDLPARLASLLALGGMVRHFQSGRRSAWLGSAIFAGISFASYFRVGVQTVVFLQAALAWRWWVGTRDMRPGLLMRTAGFWAVSAAFGVGIFVVTWPWLWGRPVEGFLEVFAQPMGVAKGGASLEWFFGVIRPVPFYYYGVTFLVTMPILVLFAFFVGMGRTRKDAARGGESLLLWAFALGPILTSGLSFRSALNHYLLVCYPPVCVLAALGIVAASERASRWRFSPSAWRAALGGLVVASEVVIAARIHPWHLEFFNSLVGGTRSVARHHTFNVGWYGEGIRPLLDYVNANAPPGATVTCRFGPWPGLAALGSYLRSDLHLQGFNARNPLGADYVLRVGLETGSEFYRYTPDPGLYVKVHEVLAAGGNIGDVWKRRPPEELNGLVYADDFSSPQLSGVAVGLRNLNLNIFSDGKLYAVEPLKPAGVLVRIPAALLGKATTYQVQSDLQAEKGEAAIRCGTNATHCTVVASCRFFRGRLESPRLPRKGDGDLWISLEMVTQKSWAGDARAFWDYDWFDSLYVRAWAK